MSRILEKPQNDMVYEVAVIRSDFNHIIVSETKEFEEAKITWRELTDRWKKSIEDKAPFELEQPIITAFDPGLVREIKIFATPQGVQQKVGSHNPYTQRMKEEGLSNTMKYGGISGTDVLDGGYK